MEEKNIQVTVKLELQDYLNFARLSSEKLTYGIYGLVITAIIESIIIKRISDLIYVLVIVGGYEFLRRVNLKKYFVSSNLAQKEEIFNFTANGIKIVTPDGIGKANIKWTEVYGVKQDKNNICIMIGQSIGHIIPKRLLNIEQIVDLEELIKNKLDSKLLKTANRFIYACIGALIYIILTFFLLEQSNSIQDVFMK